MIKKIGTAIAIIITILLVLWLYPLTMKKDTNGDWICHNIFGHYVQCND